MSTPTNAVIAWRVAHIDQHGQLLPMFSAEEAHRQRHEQPPVVDRLAYVTTPHGFDATAAACSRGFDHRPPGPSCSCGIHAVGDPANLELLLRSAEFTPPRDLAAQCVPMVPILTQGLLADPLTVPNRATHRLVPLYEDGFADWHGERARGTVPFLFGDASPRQIGYGVLGDPAGTMRGSSFVAERAFISAEHRDWLRQPRLPIVHVKEALSRYVTELTTAAMTAPSRRP